MSPSRPLPEGSCIGGRFVVGRLLGTGGTGTVYEGFDQRAASLLAETESSRGRTDKVVLKVMHPHLFEQEQVRGRFVREAAILRHLDGPFLCPVLEAGETDEACGVAGLPYLALPFIEGRALDEALHRTLPSAHEAGALVRDICIALAHAHERGVFHRDLKPANILVSNDWRPTVIDFGLAKILGLGSGTTNLTESGMLFGTPEYMAPEQVRGEEVDERTDIWAAGCVLYEALTGTRPFGERTTVATMNAILEETVTPPSERLRKVRPNSVLAREFAALEAIACHALAKRPEDRYETANDMAAALALALVSSDLPPREVQNSVHPACFRAPHAAIPSAAELHELAHATTDLDLANPEATGARKLATADPSAPSIGSTLRQEVTSRPVPRPAPSNPALKNSSHSDLRPARSLRSAEPGASKSGAEKLLGIVAAVIAIAFGVALALRK